MCGGSDVAIPFLVILQRAASSAVYVRRGYVSNMPRCASLSNSTRFTLILALCHLYLVELAAWCCWLASMGFTTDS